MEVGNMVHQCAWCGSFTVKGLRITTPMPKISNYSHGICSKCKCEVLGKYEEERKNTIETCLLSEVS